MLHTISPRSSGCTGAATQYVAIIGPAVGGESKAINPFLLLFAPRLAVTGRHVIGQERACPLRFTLISLRLQTPVLQNLPPPSPQSGSSSPTPTCHLASIATPANQRSERFAEIEASPANVHVHASVCGQKEGSGFAFRRVFSTLTKRGNVNNAASGRRSLD